MEKLHPPLPGLPSPPTALAVLSILEPAMAELMTLELTPIQSAALEFLSPGK